MPNRSHTQTCRHRRQAAEWHDAAPPSTPPGSLKGRQAADAAFNTGDGLVITSTPPATTAAVAASDTAAIGRAAIPSSTREALTAM
jgi:hypothetical protein